MSLYNNTIINNKNLNELHNILNVIYVIKSSWKKIILLRLNDDLPIFTNKFLYAYLLKIEMGLSITTMYNENLNFDTFYSIKRLMKDTFDTYYKCKIYHENIANNINYYKYINLIITYLDRIEKKIIIEIYSINMLYTLMD